MEIKEYKEYNEEEIARLYTAVGWTAYTDNMPVLREGFKNSMLVLAAYDGEVVAVSYTAAMGNYVMIDHGGGIVTLYAHLNSMSVGVGSSVSQGQTIGGVGNTGTVYGADGVHLHFEVRVNGSTTDPLNYIGGYPHSFY